MTTAQPEQGSSHDAKRIGKRLHALRGAMSQPDLARRAGITHATISRFEGGGDVYLFTARAIARALNLTLNDLVGDGAPQEDEQLTALRALAGRLDDRDRAVLVATARAMADSQAVEQPAALRAAEGQAAYVLSPEDEADFQAVKHSLLGAGVSPEDVAAAEPEARQILARARAAADRPEKAALRPPVRGRGRAAR